LPAPCVFRAVIEPRKSILYNISAINWSRGREYVPDTTSETPSGVGTAESENRSDTSRGCEPSGAEAPYLAHGGLRRFFAVSPTSPPDRPLLEAVLLFAAFYLVSFAPADPGAAGSALGTASYHGLVLLELVPKSLLVLYLMARAEGLAAFGVGAPRAADIPRGVMAAIGATAIVLGPAFILSSLGWSNPLLATAGGPSSPAALLAPLILASSLAVGYGEELFFRAYLTRRLGQAGLPPFWAAVASTLVFGSAHGLQGAPGMLVAALLGGLLAWRWHHSRNIHEIALGHAMYDAAVMALALFGNRA